VETVEEGENVLVGEDIQNILFNIQQGFPESSFRNAMFGDGNAPRHMSKLIRTFAD
jgi:hypothetical protein